MRPITILALAAAWALAPAAPAAAGEQGFVTLFDGQDVSAWTMAPSGRWVVEDGAITLRGEMDGREHNAEYLWTKDAYGDFVLELEFRIPEQANSGVFLRTADRNDPVYTGIEIQVANSFGRQEWGRGNCAGAIYDCVAPVKNTVRPPGEWNHFRITCQKSYVSVELNGELVSQMNLDHWTEPNKNPDGTPNKFETPLRDFARSGHVGLQDHGRPVWYRNIRIKRLD